MSQEMAKLREGILKYPRVEAEVRQSQTEENPAVVQQKVYDALSKEVGVDSKVLQQKLPDVAINLQRAPDATTYEKANAAYVANNFEEAERLALQAIDELQKTSSKPAEIVRAYQLAGFSAQKRIQYKTALEYFRAAEKLTDRQTNPAQWADVQHATGDLLMEQGSYRDAEEVLRAAAEAREHALGADNADTLRSRTRVAYSQYRQGKYNDAVESFRRIVATEEKIFGPMHADTLLARNGLAIALDNAGKPAEAEAEHRRILAIREKVLGSENADTLRTRNNIALTLDRQGKHAQAASEYQQVIDLENKVLGPEHPDTLRSRSSFAYALDHQGKYSEAELNLRDVIRLEERVLGPEHPDTLISRLRLDKVLMSQSKFGEAEIDFRNLVTVAEPECREVLRIAKNLRGPDHLETLDAFYDLAGNLARESKLPEAKELARRAADSARRTLGPNRPATQKYTKFLAELETKNAL